MNRTHERTTHDKLRLRDDLRFVPRIDGSSPWVLIESPSQGEYYHVGYPEYVFLSLLDGQTTFAAALALSSQTLGAEALTEPQAVAVWEWLIEHRLTHDSAQECSTKKSSSCEPRQMLPRWSSNNPFAIKWSWGSIDAWIDPWLPLCRWCFAPSAIIAGFVLQLTAFLAVLSQSERFIDSSRSILDRSSWLWLAAAWIALKTAHELAHAMACRQWGGEVRDAGITWMFCAPMPYVDVTSSWRFTSRWQRMSVAAAGMYIEMILAAIAAIIWCRTTHPFVAQLLHHIVLMASVTTLLFNLNPLMRFDGYYLLADGIQMPQLAHDGWQACRELVRRLLLGDARSTLRVGGMRRWGLVAYGLSAALWRMLVCSLLLLAASIAWHGAGLLLTSLAIACWCGPWIRGFLSHCRNWSDTDPRIGMRPALILIATFLTVIAALRGLPAPVGITMPGVVHAADETIIRAQGPGFVREVFVRDNQMVAAGQVLIMLENEDLSHECSELQSRIDESRLRQRVALDQSQVALAQIERRNERALRLRLAEKERELASLTIRSPHPGRVVHRQLDQLQGTYLKVGDEVAAIVNDQRKEVRVLIDQDDIDRVLGQVGESVVVRVGSQPRAEGRLAIVEPRASREILEEALASTEGGPLAVIARDDKRETAPLQRYELAESRFRGFVHLEAATAKQVACGQVAQVAIGRFGQSFGGWLLECAYDLFRTRTKTK